MFNKDFYPTPQEVIETMLEGLDVQDKVILEPSAGKGDIVKALNSLNAKEVLTCEIEDDLAQIVQPISNYIGKDFMEVQADKVSHINLIIMNPPFSKGVEHINHAWDIAPEGCEIVALCNWETINNRHTRQRMILNQTINENGEAINLGDVFRTAERKTGVEVAMVRLHKPLSDESDKYTGFFMDEEPEEESGAPGLMPYNEVRDIVQRYVGTVEAFKKLDQAASVVNGYIKPLGLSNGMSYSIGYGNTVTSVEAFAKELQKKSWEWIIDKTGVKKYVTSKVMQDINKFVEQQTKYPFTMKNIYKMLEIIVKTRSQTMDRAVIDVFDKITYHHHDNRHQVEGWKTNKQYVVGKKFILEWVTEIGWSGQMGIRYNGNQTKLNDLTKVLKYLTGSNKDMQDLEHFSRNMWSVYNDPYTGEKKEKWVERDPKLLFGTWYEWGFFEIKGYKKGTMHVKFKDLKHWELFNRKVAEIKGFELPEKM